MRFRTLLFDLDGTLVDAFTTIYRSYVHTLPRFGYPEPSYEAVRAAVGGGLENALARFVPREQVAELLPEYQKYTQSILLDDVRLLPGALPLLQSAARLGISCAVLTNKHGPSARRICEHLGLTPHLKAVFGAGDTSWLKPHAAFALHAIEAIGGHRDTACLVGDSPYDLAAARASGIAFAGVSTGTHTAGELRAAGAESVTADLEELGRTWQLL